MKRGILLVGALCLSLLSYAQKAPKRTFSTETATSEIKWQNGDLISLPDGDEPAGVIYTVENDGDKTYFAGRGATRTEDGYWVALYPSSALKSWEEDGLHFVIPHEQVIGETVAPMCSRTDATSLDFKPLTAYLQLGLASGQTPVKEIRITSNKYISGDYKAVLDQKNVSVQLDTGTRFREIVLKPKEGDVIAPGEYVMPIFARTLPDGVDVEIVSVDGRVEVRKIAGELAFTLGKTRDIGIINDLDFEVGAQSVIGADYQGQGLVFWVNPEDKSKAKVVAASAQVLAWADQNDLYGINTFKENYDKVHTTVTNHPAYKADPEKFQAVYACEQMRKTYGGNWHVPSALEMKYLFNAYYGNTGGVLPENGLAYTDEESLAAASSFDAQLVALGGEGMLAQSDKYWICGQNSSGNMQYVNMRKFLNGHDVQTTAKYVRCIRDVQDNGTDRDVDYPQSEVAQLLKSDACPKVVDVVWDTTFTVTPGLDFYQMRLYTEAYDKLDLYLLRVDQSKGIDVRAAVSGEATTSVWKRQIPSEMAAYMDSPERPVYALVNADFCENRAPIRPRGPHHSDGKIWISSYSIDPKLPQQALSFVGVTYEGKMVIAPNVDYQATKKDLKECTGAGVILLMNSEIQGGYVTDPARDPRTAIGYTSDNIVWILAVDGRHKGTEGMTYMEMAEIFRALGCEAAVNLDGGGSTQMLVRDPQTDEIKMRNWPSDPTKGFGGRERARLNGWMIMKH